MDLIAAGHLMSTRMEAGGDLSLANSRIDVGISIACPFLAPSGQSEQHIC